MKLKLKKLIAAAFGTKPELRLKKLRNRVCAAAEEAYAVAGEEAPDRLALETAFAAKLAKLPGYVVEGKVVRKAGLPAAVEDEDEQLNEAEEGEEALTQGQRPSEVQWHTTPGHAQRFGPFSQDEEDTLDAAVAALAQEEGESGEDLGWLFATRASRKGRRLWLQLAAALPARSPRQVWGHATRRLHPARLDGKASGSTGRWSADDDTNLREAVDEHGKDWIAVSQVLGRPPDACRDRYRKVDGRAQWARGRWTADEVELLAAAVKAQLDARPPPPKPGTGRAFMTRDNVNWAAVAAALGDTRSAAQCTDKYYRDVAPSMVAAGLWAKSDDQVLLQALHAAQADEATALDWAALVPGRGATETLRRWKLMVKHVPRAVDVGFPGCVAFLYQRFGSKPPAPSPKRKASAAAREAEEEEEEEEAIATTSSLKKHKKRSKATV